MFKKIAAAMLLFWAGCSLAMSPENGVWWNPAESGTGYNFEIQNDRLGIYAYTYEANGLPVYLYSVTSLTGPNQFTGTLFRSANGPCIACSYRPSSAAEVGAVRIVFDSPTTATLTATTAEGTRSTRLQRFAFAVDERSPYKMFGEWSFVIGTSAAPIYFAERIAFGGTFTSSSGAVSASGYRTGSPSNPALARQDTDGSWSLLMDSSTSYYTYFVFRFSGLNTMEGRSWTFLKTSTVSGAGIPFIGLRSGSANSVITGVGPALQQSSRPIMGGVINYESVDTTKAQLSSTPSVDGNESSDTIRAREVVRELLNQ